MPRGIGFFYDRRKNKLLKIEEHASDAVANPDKFRCKKIAHLNPITDRDTIVIYVLRRGFIRIRYWKNTLSWQFWGAEKKSREILKKFAKRNGVGPFCLVTYSDFKSKKTRTVFFRNI